MPATAWDWAAPLYDVQLALELRALDAALEVASPAAGDRVLGLAGTGALLRRLAHGPDPPRAVLGVDASAAMLARAPALPPTWRLRRVDATQLPLPTGGYDLVCAAYLLHVLDATARWAVLEVTRGLAPEGRLVLVPVTAPPPSILAVAFAALAAWARHGPGILAGLRPLDPRPELRAAGFDVMRVRRRADIRRWWCWPDQEGRDERDRRNPVDLSPVPDRARRRAD